MNFFNFCSGIGAERLDLEKIGLKCVGHSEINEKAINTYKILFENSRNFDDVTKINIPYLPNFEFMIAEFPCQTFFIAGKREGFKDERGQIIYSLMNIL